jgi:hypothetical protein
MRDARAWITLMGLDALGGQGARAARIAARRRWAKGQAWPPLDLVQSCAGDVGSAPASRSGVAGEPVTARTEPPADLDAAARAAFIARSKALAPQYRTELLGP